MRCAVLVSLSYLMAGSLPANAETVVSFVHPEQFTDASLQGGYGPTAEQPALWEELLDSLKAWAPGILEFARPSPLT